MPTSSRRAPSADGAAAPPRDSGPSRPQPRPVDHGAQDRARQGNRARGARGRRARGRGRDGGLRRRGAAGGDRLLRRAGRSLRGDHRLRLPSGDRRGGRRQADRPRLRHGPLARGARRGGDRQRGGGARRVAARRAESPTRAPAPSSSTRSSRPASSASSAAPCAPTRCSAAAPRSRAASATPSPRRPSPSPTTPPTPRASTPPPSTPRAPPAGKRALIEAGELAAYLHDSYTARREQAAGAAGARTTANASRAGYRSPPSVSTSNLVVAPGAKSFEELLAEAGEGVYVTDVAGLHSGVNPVSGTFSVGATGRLIEGGQLAAPADEFTIASDLQSMLKAITAAGSEPRWVPFGGSVNAPALLIGEMAVGGS